MRANRAAFERRRIVPADAAGPRSRDLSIELLGRQLPAPLLLAPVGAAGMVARDSDLEIARGRRRSWACPTSCPTRAAAPWRRSPRRWATRPGGSSSTGRPTNRSSTACSRRAEASGARARSSSRSTRPCSAGARRTSTSARCRSRQGIGIAQYTSDPRFQEIVRERMAAKAAGRARADDVKVTLGAIRSLLSISREHPGDLRDNLRSPAPRAAVETFLDIYSNPGLTWDQLATLREPHRPAGPPQGGPAPGRRPARRRARRQRDRRVATTVAARSTAPSPPSTPWPDPRGRGTRAAARARQRRPHRQPTSSRPSRSAPTRWPSAGPTSTAWPSPAGRCAGRPGQHRRRARPHDGPVRGGLGGRDRTRTCCSGALMARPHLTTPRLELRPLHADDSDLLVELDGDPDVMEFLTRS